ncbi:MAG TPA: hypothetical protein VGC39_03095 [Candidatus Methylacidiphilales bacterium]
MKTTNHKQSKNTSSRFGLRHRAPWLLLALGAWLGSSPAWATEYTWSGGGSSNHGWLQQPNYVGGASSGTYSFTAADTIYYSNLSGASSKAPVFGSAGTIGTLEFGAETGANPITIGWQNTAVINLASGIQVDSGAGANIINAPLVLSGTATTFTNNSSNILTLSALSGSSSLSLNGGAFNFQALNGGVFNYTGPTTVNAGATLRVLSTASLTGSVDVKSSATLGGRGTIGATEIESGGTLAPGVPATPASSIAFSSSLKFDLGSLAQLDLTNTANDSINVAGALTYGGELRLTLSDDFNTPGNYTLFTSGSESGNFDALTLYNSSGELGALTFDSGIWSGQVDGLSYSFDQSSGDLSVGAVPEPGVTVLGAVAFLALFVWRKRKTQGFLSAPRS